MSAKTVLLKALFCGLLIFFGELFVGRSNPQSGRSVLGVPLSPPTVGLLNQVESIYGQAVQFESNPQLSDFTLAQAIQKIDGTPVVQINPKMGLGLHEAQIAHELMHLLCWAEGVSLPHFIIDGDVNDDVRAAVDLLGDKGLYDQVLHAYFYPRIRNLGLDPSVPEKERIRGFLESGIWPVRAGWLRTPDLALYYFRAVVVLKDDALARDIATAFALHAQHDAVVMGKEMVDAVTKKPFPKPADVTPTFVRAANVAMRGHFRLSLWCVRPVRRGKIQQQIAAIAIEPVLSPVSPATTPPLS